MHVMLFQEDGRNVGFLWPFWNYEIRLMEWHTLFYVEGWHYYTSLHIMKVCVISIIIQPHLHKMVRIWKYKVSSHLRNCTSWKFITAQNL